jgi:pimeloyl-ACP methyl ester carboxylesterase
MAVVRLYLAADAAINPDRAHQQQLFELDTAQMNGFVDWADEELTAMTTPTLVLAGDRDVYGLSTAHRWRASARTHGC